MSCAYLVELNNTDPYTGTRVHREHCVDWMKINLWKNNIDFFASSKNADKLKKDFQVKIDKANAQLKNLKEQLKIILSVKKSHYRIYQQ